MTKLCLFCFRQTLPMAKHKTELFCFVFFRVPKWRKQKTNKRGQKFFFFLSRQQCCCATQWNLFFFTIFQNQQAFGNCLWLKEKKATLFSCLRIWEVTFLQKSCKHQRFVTKSNGQFHFFVTPTHQVMIVITNANVFGHPPTQV